MNKSKIRKHILEVRKKNNSENLNVNFQHILKILRTLGKGEVSTYIQKADELFANKTGNK